MRENIEKLSQLKTLNVETNKVEDFLLFKKIFEQARRKTQVDPFLDTKSKLEEIKMQFKEQLSNT